MCPRLFVHPALPAQSAVHRSWWKCRRPYPVLLYYSGVWSRSLTFLFFVEVHKVFTPDRVPQRRLRRSLTFLLVEVLTVFSPDRVPQRLPLRMLNFRLVEVFTVYAHDRVFRRFLDLITAMMLFGVHAEVEDLLEVLKAPSQDRAQQPEVELVIAGLLVVSSSCLDPEVAASYPVQCGGRVRPSSLWWVPSPRLVAGALRRRRVRDVLCPEWSGRLHGGL